MPETVTLDNRYIVAVQGIVHHNGRYLMIVRSEQDENAPGTLTFPAGKVEGVTDLHNVLELAVAREVKEETGVVIAPDPYYLNSQVFMADNGQPIVLVNYLCGYAGGQAMIGDPEEVSEVRWMTPAEILSHPKAPAWTQSLLLAAEAVIDNPH